MKHQKRYDVHVSSLRVRWVPPYSIGTEFTIGNCHSIDKTASTEDFTCLKLCFSTTNWQLVDIRVRHTLFEQEVINSHTDKIRAIVPTTWLASNVFAVYEFRADQIQQKEFHMKECWQELSCQQPLSTVQRRGCGKSMSSLGEGRGWVGGVNTLGFYGPQGNPA